MSAIVDTYSLLPVGTQAPDFDLPATGGRQVKLADYLGKNLIVVFYPKDQTPGCTQQLCALRDDTELFQGLNTEFVGCNPDSMESHEKFAAAQSYKFPILVDANRTMAKAYRALKEDGKGIQRTVYIIDTKGVIRFAKQGLPPDSELVEIIKTLN
ncbi:peroxiredoxin family protein [Vampirovibrio sp.]|uniref:peroxiredoxin family protein n=1 Tax=Vampirovibrio sp. TaxID=2717857 RepID=UPI0035947051